MMTAASLNKVDRRQARRSHGSAHMPRLILYARQNVRLAQENQVLRQSYVELTTAAETWIRLYEAALERANAAEQEIARLSGGQR
jgi:hypothetical protein